MAAYKNKSRTEVKCCVCGVETKNYVLLIFKDNKRKPGWGCAYHAPKTT